MPRLWRSARYRALNHLPALVPWDILPAEAPDASTAWKSAGGGLEAFDAQGVACVRFAIDSPPHYRVMFGGVVDDAVHGLSMLIIDGQFRHRQGQIDSLIHFADGHVRMGIGVPGRNPTGGRARRN